jgi:hypothetical protein
VCSTYKFKNTFAPDKKKTLIGETPKQFSVLDMIRFSTYSLVYKCPRGRTFERGREQKIFATFG